MELYRYSFFEAAAQSLSQSSALKRLKESPYQGWSKKDSHLLTVLFFVLDAAGAPCSLLAVGTPRALFCLDVENSSSRSGTRALDPARNALKFEQADGTCLRSPAFNIEFRHAGGCFLMEALLLGLRSSEFL